MNGLSRRQRLRGISTNDLRAEIESRSISNITHAGRKARRVLTGHDPRRLIIVCHELAQLVRTSLHDPDTVVGVYLNGPYVGGLTLNVPQNLELE